VTIEEGEAKEALQRFDEVWESLPPRKQSEVVHLLVRMIEYDGSVGKVIISFHPSGIQSLEQSLAPETHA